MSREPELSDLPELPDIPDALGAAIVRVLNGDATDAHQAAVQTWSDESPEHAASLHALRAVWQQAQPASPRWDVERALTAVRASSGHINDVVTTRPIRRRVTSSHTSWRWRTTMVGVMAASVVAIGYLGLARVRRTTIVPAQIYSTRIAQRATVQLADGSTALLAPQTTLTVRGTTAELVGEAYFDIAHASHTPFVVKTGAVTTRVLGTAFTVRRYADDHETLVAVTSGKVAVAGRHAVTLIRGNVGRVTDSSETVADTGAAQYTAWTTGQLVFRDMPLPDLLATVGRWYGVRFRLTDSTLASRRITATVDLGSQTEFMRALALVLDAKLTFSDTSNHVILIRSGHDAPAPAPLRRERMDLSPTAKEIGR